MSNIATERKPAHTSQGTRGKTERADKPAAKKGSPKWQAEKKGAKKGAKKRKKVLTAKTADRHELYQLAVQSPDEDVKFLARVYKKVRKKSPKHFREDFCGTAVLSASWVKRGKAYSAEGFDICGDTIAWGLAHNFESLGDKAGRATLHVKDVREQSHKKPDVRAAQNFSYMVFKTREGMRDYLQSAYDDLAQDGVFVMDLYGGPESMEEMEEVRKIDEGFTYVWDQAVYWPATGDYKAHIHFRFKDGTEIKRAFSYEWRLWTLPELLDIMREVGFEHVDQYWEGTDEDGESGNGVYRMSRRGENCLAWVTYLVGYK